MAVAWSSIIVFNVFCFVRLFRESKDKMVSPIEIEAEIDGMEAGLEKPHSHREING